jgi:hypothetical protein
LTTAADSLLLFLGIFWAVIFAVSYTITIFVSVFDLFRVLPTHIKAINRSVSILVVSEIVGQATRSLEDVSKPVSIGGRSSRRIPQANIGRA